MNKPLALALLVPACTAVAMAAPTNGGAGDAGTWSTLDRSLALSGEDQAAKAGPEIGALIRSALITSSDDYFGFGGNEDWQGFTFHNAKLWAKGAVGAFDWHLSADFSDGGALLNGGLGGADGDGLAGLTLENAYASWNATDSVALWMGQLKNAPNFSASVSDGGLLFMDRTFLGSFFDAFVPAFGAAYSTEQWGAFAVLGNGQDGAAEDLELTLRGEFYIGAGGLGHEGALGSTEELQGTIGLGYYQSDDQVGPHDFGSVVIVDAALSWKSFGVNAEIGSTDDDLADTIGLQSDDEAMPWSLAASFLLPNNEWEVAARFQDLDDEDDTTALDVGLNWYRAGHSAKWQLNFSDYDSDTGIDGSVVQLGLSVGGE